jgi:hypothetical protein
VSWKIVYLPETSVVQIAYSGVISLAEVRISTQGVDALGKEHSVKRILVDVTEMEHRLATHEIYEIPRIYDSIGLTRTRRIAFVFPEGFTYARDYKFYEDVCVNSGYLIRPFTTAQDALLWSQESLETWGSRGVTACTTVLVPPDRWAILIKKK